MSLGGFRDQLCRCLSAAASVHDGQLDKQGRPYILHPLRVMMAALAEGLGDDAACAAVLHDAVEDAGVGQADAAAMLRRWGIPEPVVALVERLTHREGETYEEYIERVDESAAAAQVKLLDLADNMDPRRGIPGAAGERLRERYSWARDRLSGAGAFDIKVNGRAVKVSKSRLSYGDVVALAGWERTMSPSVTFRHPEEGGGCMTRGGRVAVVDGTVFNVANTSGA